MRNIAFLLSLVLVFVIPWEGVTRIPGMGTGAKLIGIAVAAIWLATIIITGRLRKPTPFHLMFSLFVAWNAVTIFWSADPKSTVAHVFTWVQLLVMVFVLWDLYTTRFALSAALQTYVLGAYVALGSALTNYFSGRTFYSHYQRYSPGEINPDGFGVIVALGIPVAWYLASLQGTTKTSRLLKLVNYVYIPAAFLGIALSGTRTAFIEFLIGMAFGLASMSRVRLWVRGLIFLLLLTSFSVLLPVVQPLRSFERLGTIREEVTEGDLNNRLNNWQEGLDSFVEHPLLGVGSNMYRSVNSLGKVAHNSFLSILVELGLVGFALFASILAIAVVKARRQPGWDSMFWLTTLLVWAIGASSLTWEHRKTTWLFLSLLIASAALNSQHNEVETSDWRHGSKAEAAPASSSGRLSLAAKERPSLQ